MRLLSRKTILTLREKDDLSKTALEMYEELDIHPDNIIAFRSGMYAKPYTQVIRVYVSYEQMHEIYDDVPEEIEININVDLDGDSIDDFEKDLINLLDWQSTVNPYTISYEILEKGVTKIVDKTYFV